MIRLKTFTNVTGKLESSSIIPRWALNLNILKKLNLKQFLKI